MVAFGCFARKCLLIVAAGLSLASVAANPSVAQLILPNAVAWPGLSQDNLDRMNAAAARLYEGHSIGTVERWRNPDSKDAGEVKLVRKFESHGMPCRVLDYIIRFETARNSPTHYVVNWCRIEGGEWRIVELPRRR
jgi:surface antigen